MEIDECGPADFEPASFPARSALLIAVTAHTQRTDALVLTSDGFPVVAMKLPRKEPSIFLPPNLCFSFAPLPSFLGLSSYRNYVATISNPIVVFLLDYVEAPSRPLRTMSMNVLRLPVECMINAVHMRHLSLLEQFHVICATNEGFVVTQIVPSRGVKAFQEGVEADLPVAHTRVLFADEQRCAVNDFVFRQVGGSCLGVTLRFTLLHDDYRVTVCDSDIRPIDQSAQTSFEFCERRLLQIIDLQQWSHELLIPPMEKFFTYASLSDDGEFLVATADHDEMILVLRHGGSNEWEYYWHFKVPHAPYKVVCIGGSHFAFACGCCVGLMHCHGRYWTVSLMAYEKEVVGLAADPLRKRLTVTLCPSRPLREQLILNSDGSNLWRDNIRQFRFRFLHESESGNELVAYTSTSSLRIVALRWLMESNACQPLADEFIHAMKQANSSFCLSGHLMSRITHENPWRCVVCGEAFPEWAPHFRCLICEDEKCLGCVAAVPIGVTARSVRQST
jgi:hypothetical protein